MMDAKRRAVKEIMRKAKRSRYGDGGYGQERDVPGVTITIGQPGGIVGPSDYDDEGDEEIVGPSDSKRRRRKDR